MNAIHATRITGLILLALAGTASCEIATFGEGKGGHHGRGGCNRDHDHDHDHDDDDDDGPIARRDGGHARAPAPDATATAPSPDAGVVAPPDTGVVGAPDTGPTSPPDAGFAPDAAPECANNTDCLGGLVCSPQGTCVQPDCPNVTTEAACVARADCIPIYSGMNCTDAEGGECLPGDVNCTCATFAFAVCGRRPQ